MTDLAPVSRCPLAKHGEPGPNQVMYRSVLSPSVAKLISHKWPWQACRSPGAIAQVQQSPCDLPGRYAAQERVYTNLCTGCALLVPGAIGLCSNDSIGLEIVLADLRLQFSSLLLSCSSVVRRLLRAKDQHEVCRCIIACLDRMASHSCHIAPSRRYSIRSVLLAARDQ